LNPFGFGSCGKDIDIAIIDKDGFRLLKEIEEN